MLARLRCRLLACYTGAFPVCERCGADVYDGAFIEPMQAPWPRLAHACWRLRKRLRRYWPWKRCVQCGCVFMHGWDNELCSAKCFDAWIPF